MQRRRSSNLWNRAGALSWALLLSASFWGLAVVPAGAQSATSGAQMANFQQLVCHYSPGGGELSLALLSISNRTDPSKQPGLPGQLEVKVEVDAERSEVVPSEHLKVAVLGDFRSELDRKYNLFRFNLVIDESTSIDTPDLVEARRIIDGFLRRIPVVYRAQVIRFATQVAPPSVFTNDVDALRRALGEGSQRLLGGTSFYNAVDQALRELTLAKQEVPLRFTIAFTDGADTSGRDFASFKSSLQRKLESEQIFLFIAGIGTRDQIQHDQLRQLPGSMGLYFELEKVPDVDEVFDTVAKVLDKTYIVRIPIVSSHRGARKLYIMSKRQGARSETIQDIVLPPRCVPP